MESGDVNAIDIFVRHSNEVAGHFPRWVGPGCEQPGATPTTSRERGTRHDGSDSEKTEDCRDLDMLARRLQIARADVNMTQAQAATKAKISRSALSLYEKARRKAHVTSIKRLALVYGVSMDWLMGMSETMRSEEMKLRISERTDKN